MIFLLAVYEMTANNHSDACCSAIPFLDNVYLQFMTALNLKASKLGNISDELQVSPIAAEAMA